jgi:hypothetical protein
MATTDAFKTFTTDPGCYTDSIPKGIPSSTLYEIHDNAAAAYNRAGGHNFAAQMQRVMDNVDRELRARGEQI